MSNIDKNYDDILGNLKKTVGEICSILDIDVEFDINKASIDELFNFYKKYRNEFYRRRKQLSFIPPLKTKKVSKREQLTNIKETREEQIIRRMFKIIYDEHFDCLTYVNKFNKPIPNIALDIGNYVQGHCPVYYEHMKKRYKYKR